jgi:hypothetical protein
MQHCALSSIASSDIVEIQVKAGNGMYKYVQYVVNVCKFV